MVNIYRNEEGIELPGVTTMLKELSQERLEEWKLKEALKTVVSLAGKRGAVPNTMRQVKAKLEGEANLGKWLHEVAARKIKGLPSIPDIEGRVSDCQILEANLDKYLEDRGSMDVIAVEHPIQGYFHVPSMGMMVEYGGTLDLVIGHIRRVILLDYKSSRVIHPEHVAQICAYGNGWNQEQEQRIDTLQIVQIYKWPVKEGELPYRVFQPNDEEMALAWLMFQQAATTWYIRSGRWGNILS